MKEFIQSDSALDSGRVEAVDWGSELDEIQIRRRQLLEIANEIFFMLRKKPEPQSQPRQVVAAVIE